MDPPPVLVIEHETKLPAVDCLVASALLITLAAGWDRPLNVFRLASPARSFRFPWTTEHVAAHGELQVNSMLWLERAVASIRQGGVVRCTAGNHDLPRPALVSVNPALTDGAALGWLRRLAAESGKWVKVEGESDGFEVFLERGRERRRVIAHRLFRDAYGRLPSIPIEYIPPELLNDLGVHRSLRTGGAEITKEGPTTMVSPRLVIVGEETYLTSVYPAVLASLGDAADRIGAAPKIEILSPHGAQEIDWSRVLRGVDGLVLPGGSDMSQAAGQIAAAHVALRKDIPTVGLCLGMQTMTTAFLRDLPGMQEADLEETTPGAPVISFKRLIGPKGEAVHYLGAREIVIGVGSILHRIFGNTSATERLNHRYHLNPELVPLLKRAGLAVSAHAREFGVAEGIEIGSHPFFLAIQGHPELSSCGSGPHPLLVALIAAATDRHRTRSSMAN